MVLSKLTTCRPLPPAPSIFFAQIWWWIFHSFQHSGHLQCCWVAFQYILIRQTSTSEEGNRGPWVIPEITGMDGEDMVMNCVQQLIGEEIWGVNSKIPFPKKSQSNLWDCLGWLKLPHPSRNPGGKPSRTSEEPPKNFLFSALQEVVVYISATGAVTSLFSWLDH